MVAPRFKSGSMKQTQVRTPGGRTVTHYYRAKHKQASCAGCGKKLSGIAHDRPFRMKNTAKSRKTVSRPYGGQLCSKCSRAKIVSKARKEE